MALRQLIAKDFRNIANADIQFCSQWNVLMGDNGSGKTSVLEAIYVLSHGRSFRTTKLQKVIQHDCDELTLFARIDWSMQQLALGVQRTRSGEWLARLNGEAVQRVADCASVLPVQLLQPESFRLFFGGPKERRQFFDLGLFHVEPSFYQTWLQFQKVLKHRNALLKSRQGYNEQYHYWDQQFVQLSLQLKQQRQRYLHLLRQAILPLTAQVPFLSQLTVDLYAGWSEQGSESSAEQHLLALLQQNFSSDLKFGYTQIGPQKADLKLKIADDAVEEILSRGQLKVLLFALKIAQSNVIYDSGFKQPLLLIDDLASELDDDSKRYVFDFLHKTQSQVFITAIEESQILPLLSMQSEVGVFHVEHGQIKRTDNDGRR